MSIFKNPSFKNLNPSADFDTIMQEAGLDFFPEKRPLHYFDSVLDEFGNVVKDEEGNVKVQPVPSKYSCAVVRDGHELGTVGLKYGLVPYPTAFSFVEDLCLGGEAEWKASVSINHGAKAFLILRTGDEFNLGSSLSVQNTFMLMSSHNGECKVMGKSIPYVDANGVVLCVPGSDFNIEVKHTQNAESKLVDIKRTMRSVREAWQECDELFRRAVATPLNNEGAVSYLTEVMGEAKSTRSENILNQILTIWQGEGKISRHPACKGTLFGMLMAVAEYCDHFKVVRKSKKVDENEARILATLTGEAARQKAKAYGVMYHLING